MQRLFVAGLIVGGFLLSADAAQAFGGRRGHNCGSASDCGGCGAVSDCCGGMGGCGTGGMGNACCAAPEMEARQMTGQRPVARTRMVQREVTEMVSRMVQEQVK